MREDQEIAKAQAQNSLKITLKTVEFTLKPLGNPQFILTDAITQTGLFWGKITYSSSSMETNRLTGDEDGAREISFILLALFSTH